MNKPNRRIYKANPNYYVCSKYGCIWMGKEEEMRQDYSYGPDLWVFASEEEAEEKLKELQDENLVDC